MAHTALRVGLIGAGRAGSVIARALERVGHPCLAVSAVSDASRRRAAALLPSADVIDPMQVCERVDLILIAVPDDALASVAQGLVNAGAIQARHIVVHLSGRHGVAPLAPAAEVGATVIALHPAMTLHGRLEDVERLRHCPFAVTAADEALPIGQALVYEMGAVPHVIAESHRTLYHAALAHASNHGVTLLVQSMEMLQSIGVETPGDYLRPLAMASVEGALRDGDAALTGPVARGDFDTVRAHVRAIEASDLPGSTSLAYRAMAKATARRRGAALELPGDAS